MMDAIRHRVGIKTSVENAYESVFTPEKLEGWWATAARGSTELGSQIELEFPGYPSFLWEIAEKSNNERVVLKWVSGPDPWRGSDIQVFVTLTHRTTEETPPEAFQYFCTKWPLFLVSLKEFLETGSGRPYPNDIRIQHDTA